MRLLEQTALSFQERAASPGMISNEQVQESTVSTHTERLRSSLIALISIFLRPIVKDYGRTMRASGNENREASRLVNVSRAFLQTVETREKASPATQRVPGAIQRDLPLSRGSSRG